MSNEPVGSPEWCNVRATVEFVHGCINDRLSQEAMELSLQDLYRHGSTSVRYALREANQLLIENGYRPVSYEQLDV